MDNNKKDRILTKFFYIVFQILKVLLIKICKIQPLDLLFLVVFISFYIIRYHFSQVFRTSFNIIWKKDFFTNFPFLTDSLTPPRPPPPPPPLSFFSFFYESFVIGLCTGVWDECFGCSGSNQVLCGLHSSWKCEATYFSCSCKVYYFVLTRDLWWWSLTHIVTMVTVWVILGKGL